MDKCLGRCIVKHFNFKNLIMGMINNPTLIFTRSLIGGDKRIIKITNKDLILEFVETGNDGLGEGCIKQQIITVPIDIFMALKCTSRERFMFIAKHLGYGLYTPEFTAELSRDSGGVYEGCIEFNYHDGKEMQTMKIPMHNYTIYDIIDLIEESMIDGILTTTIKTEEENDNE